MNRPDRRTFKITDAMVLIAATAVGLALARGAYPYDLLRPRVGSYLSWLLNGPSSCLVAAWAMAVVVLRLRRPRPPRRRLVRQPGFVAGVASLMAMLLGSVCGRISFGTLYSQLYRHNLFQVDDYWSWAIRPTGAVVFGRMGRSVVGGALVARAELARPYGSGTRAVLDRRGRLEPDRHDPSPLFSGALNAWRIAHGSPPSPTIPED